MAFVTKADIEQQMRAYLLAQIVASDDTKIDRAISRTVAEMKGYLSARYDNEQIFSAVGVARDQQLLGLAVEMVIYHIHTLVNPLKIPADVKERYEKAVEWLFLVSQQKINPDGLPVPTQGTKDYIVFGGRTARENHI